MLSTPRFSSRSGLSSGVTLWLALAGAGTVVFLFFLFAGVTNSRAAEPRSTSHVQAPPVAENSGSQADAPRHEALLLPPVLEGTDAAEIAETPATTPVEADPALAAPAGLLAAKATTGPKLTYESRKGKGKEELVQPGQAGKAQAAQLKAQRERAVEEALARGEEPPPARTRPPNPNPKLEGKESGKPDAEKKGAGDGTAKGKKKGRSFERRKKS